VPGVAVRRRPAAEAVALLHKKGFRASKISDGIAEWSAAGMPLEGQPPG